jgi:hypothetical protein
MLRKMSATNGQFSLARTASKEAFPALRRINSFFDFA